MHTNDASPSLNVVSRLGGIVELVPTAIMMVDDRGTIMFVNREVELMFGYGRIELIGRPVEALVPERSRPAHPGLRSGFFAAPQARRMGTGRDLHAVRKDGSEFPVEIGLSPTVTEYGTFVLCAIADITLRKRMEEALRDINEELERRVAERTAQLARANEALERSNLELQQFAYVASHDLQAPLRSISGFVQLLQQDYAEKLDAQAHEWIRRTLENARHMQTLILDLLSYARVDSRARPFDAVDCCGVFEDAVTMLAGSIRDADANVTRTELPTVVGDRSQLAQLFVNLIANGIKYHSEAPPRVHVFAEQTGSEWLFAVRDNGIGIDPQHHESIFEVFRRLHTQRSCPGTGIGLAICRRVVHRHGGRIWVESEPDRGSTFYFTIPAGPSARQPLP